MLFEEKHMHFLRKPCSFNINASFNIYIYIYIFVC